MARNIFVSMLSSIAIYFTAIPLYFAYYGLTSIFINVDNANSAVLITSYCCLVLLVFYITGTLFIKSTGKTIKDVVSIGASGILLFAYSQAVSNAPIPGNPIQFSLYDDIILAGFFLICSLLPSLFLWLGMFSRRRNREKLKAATRKRKISQVVSETGNPDETSSVK